MTPFDPALATALAVDAHPDTALTVTQIDPTEAVEIALEAPANAANENRPRDALSGDVVWEDDEYYYVFES